jgi:hypothetical protein
MMSILGCESVAGVAQALLRQRLVGLLKNASFCPAFMHGAGQTLRDRFAANDSPDLGGGRAPWLCRRRYFISDWATRPSIEVGRQRLTNVHY